MANQVFANGREISCRAGAGITTCEFPDVCFTPPQTPATPPGVPIPYPNTGKSSDTTEGSRDVVISGKEIMLKDSSYFKTSTGDEAGSAPQKGIITSTNTGKVYFIAWSMDVSVEGENVVRHLDMTTHNHASKTATGAIPLVHVDAQAIASGPECDDLDGVLSATRAEELPKSVTTTTSGTSTYDATICVGFANGSIVGGASSIGRGKVQSSKRTLRGSKYGNYAEGIQRGEESKVKTCDGKPFVYDDDPAHPKQGHAEAKIIEDWFEAGAPGTLLLNPSKQPCESCSRMINEVNNGKNGKGKCNKIKVCESATKRE